MFSAAVRALEHYQIASQFAVKSPTSSKGALMIVGSLGFGFRRYGFRVKGGFVAFVVRHFGFRVWACGQGSWKQRFGSGRFGFVVLGVWGVGRVRFVVFGIWGLKDTANNSTSRT